jgi:hypothetical protein
MSDLTALACVRQVPDNLPLVVPQRRTGRLVFYGVLTAVAVLILVFGFVKLAFEPTSGTERANGFVGLAVLGFVLLALLALIWVRVFAFPPYRGPGFAADTSGVWMRRVFFARFAVHVPWPAVRKIDTQKTLLGQVVRIEVDPAFPWPPNSLKGPRTIAFVRSQGPGLLVAVKDNDPAQFFEQLRELSGGRVPIG